MAPVKSLEDVQKTITGSSAKVLNTYLLKFGSVSISRFDLGEGQAFPVVARSLACETADPPSGGISDGLIAALSKHPNVFDLRPTGAHANREARIACGGQYLVRGPAYRAEIHIPKAQQKYQERDCVEHFSAFVSGTSFAAFGKIETLPPYSNMGHEFREIYKAQISSQTEWKSPTIGPSPLHEDFVIMELDQNSDNPERRVKIFSFRRTLCFVTTKTHAEALLEELFRECLLYLTPIYELELRRELLMESDFEIQNRLQSLLESHAEIAALPAWRIRKVQKHLSTARETLSHIYALHFEHTRSLKDYSRARQRVIENLKEARLIGEISQYVESSTEIDVDTTDSILPSLQFFQQQTDARRSFYVLVFASLMGALIGGFITAAATLLNHP